MEKIGKRKASAISRSTSRSKKTKVDHKTEAADFQRNRNSRSELKRAKAQVNYEPVKESETSSLHTPLNAAEPASTPQVNDSDQSEEDHQIDDQTALLLKGFESSSDSDADIGIDEASSAQLVRPAPLAKSLQNKLATPHSDKPGVIYVGRVPHGFYEHQMQAYFSQFGTITRLRMSRNKRTGAPKHYAFIEFASEDVAKIVADTMDNYLMFGHILKVKYVAPDQIHSELFKGAGKRFNKIPWNKLERKRLNEGKDRQSWEKKVLLEEKRRSEKAKKLEQLGYVFEAPELKKVVDVPIRKPLVASVETGDTTPEKANLIEASHSHTEATSDREALKDVSIREERNEIRNRSIATVDKTSSNKGSSATLFDTGIETERHTSKKNTKRIKKGSSDSK